MIRSHPRSRLAAPGMLAVSLLIAACGGSAPPAGSPGTDTGSDTGSEQGIAGMDPEASIAIPADLVVQLAEYPTARQVGTFAAEANGLYETELLSVLPMEADPETDPMEAVADPDAVQVYLGPSIAALRAISEGQDLVNIGQLFRGSGDRIVARSSAGLATVADLAGTSVAVLPGPAGESVLPALVASGLEPTDVELVPQPFDPDTFLATDGAIAHVRNEDEWAQLLETVDPATGTLTDPASLMVIDLSASGIAPLQDGVWVHAGWLADNEDVAIRFLRALAGGWIACRDDLEGCAQLAYESGALRPAAHQRWVLNETNRLIWPAAAGIGVTDEDAWAATVQEALAAGVIGEEPPATTLRTDLMEAALGSMTDLDTTGEAFEPADVAIVADGQDPEPSAGA